MTARELTAEDIADWLTPRQAVEILDAAYPPGSRVSKQVLLERLRGGMVQAVSGHSAFDGMRKSREVFYKIPSEDWERVDTVDILWITGELTYRRIEYGSGEHITVRHYNVRFEPQGVRAIIGSATTGTSTENQSSTKPEPEPEPEPKGPRVSDAHLQAWFEFYKKVHNEAEDTEDRALQSARMNFPGRSVSRGRVRELRGSQRRGPKKKIE